MILKRWAQNPVFLQADITFCLIAENRIELNLGLLQNPGVASLQIPMPDEQERLEFIRAQTAGKPLPAGSAALEDFIPPSYPTEIELQTLVAVLECSSKSLEAEQYRGIDRREIIRRTNELGSLTRQ